MTQEEKDLLFRDLCSRLPYKTKVRTYSCINNWINDCGDTIDEELTLDLIKNIPLIIKPYLRPLSSMTKKENDEWVRVSKMKFDMEDGFLDVYDAHLSIDYLNSHHFDYRWLIDLGLALPAPEGMYVI